MGNRILMYVDKSAIILVFLFLLSCASFCAAEDKKDEPVHLTKYLSVGVKVERLINSRTQYEFGTPIVPNSPNYAPVSRLVFPMDTWWGGLELRFNTPRFSVGGEFLANAVGDSSGLMKDYDWYYQTLTTYSESKCRLENSYRVTADADLEVADLVGLPGWLSLRPVVGFRYQKFKFMIHDGVQYDYEYGNLITPLPGDILSFRQEYFHYFAGLRSSADIGRHFGLSGLTFAIQADWAYVDGNNRDHHLLRGQRFTYDITNGYAWHVSAGLKKSLARNFFAGLRVDYTKIGTTGRHRWTEQEYGIDETWSNGVRVRSEQTGIGLTVEYRF